jgi:hypothetical protein
VPVPMIRFLDATESCLSSFAVFLIVGRPGKATRSAG